MTDILTDDIVEAAARGMTDPELIAFAAEFREGILEGAPSHRCCAMVSWPLASLLRLHGIECRSQETWLDDENFVGNHVWIELADGRVLDPTADQFSTTDRSLPPVYLGPPLDIHGGPAALSMIVERLNK